jgi:hypothetical protein
MTEVTGASREIALSTDGAGADLTVRPRTSLSSAARRRTITGLGILSLAVPVAVYLWFIHRYSVNMLWGDAWTDINVIGHAHTGNLSLATLWAQHNENRVFFPNLIVVVLGDTTHFNIVIEEYVSAAMLITATGLLILTHRRRRPSTPWVYYCPVAILMFSLVGGNPWFGPSGNTLWGFSMSWYLVLLGLAVTLFLLDRPSLTWPLLAGAMAAAVVGSLSSLQGLLIWPIGLVLLYLRRRSWRIMVVWIISAIVTVAIYFYNYNASGGFSKPSYLLAHPFGAASFFLFSVGNNITGQEVTATPTHSDLILGTLIVVVALWLVIACGLRRDASGGNPLGVSLICFGLLFTAMITAGRASYGYAFAGHYAMFELLLWVGCYLVLLDRATQPRRRALPTAPNLVGERTNDYGGSSSRVAAEFDPATGRWKSDLRIITLLTLIGLVLVQAVLTIPSGITDASAWYQRQLVAADVAVNIDEASDPLVQNYLDDYPPGFIRQMTAIARSEHLSLFDTPLAAEDTRRGLFPSIQSSILVPADYAVVSGTQILDAGVWVSNAGTKVQFRITGGLSHRTLVVAARYSPVGWFAYWDTTAVADGSYEVQSVLVYPNRARAASAPISVTVENKRTTR